MEEVKELIEVLKTFMGERNVPNESDVTGIYGRVSSRIDLCRVDYVVSGQFVS